MGDAIERVRAARDVSVGAGTARIRVENGRGMALEGVIDLQARRGRFEGTVTGRLFPQAPPEMREKLSDMGSFGATMAQLVGQMGEAVEQARAEQPRVDYVLDGGELYYRGGDRWLGGPSDHGEFGGAPPWQHDPLWLLDVLPKTTSADELGEPRAYSIRMDTIAAAEATDRAIRLPSGTLAGLRAFPAEVWLDDEGRVRRMTCGPPPLTPELPRWSAELFDYGVDEPVELPDPWPPHSDDQGVAKLG